MHIKIISYYLSFLLLVLYSPSFTKSQPAYLTTYEWGSSEDTVTNIAYHPTAAVIYASGYTYGFIAQNGQNLGSADAFVTALSLAAGPISFQWGTQFEDEATAVTVDVTTGLIYVAGWTSGLLAGVKSQGGTDAFLTTINVLGVSAYMTHMQWGTTGSDTPECAFVNPLDTHYVYVAGSTSGSFRGYKFAGGETDPFVSIVNVQQQTVNSYQWGTKGSDLVGGCGFDSTSGIFYIAGTTDGAFVGYNNSGDYDAFVSVMSVENTFTNIQWGTSDADFVTGAVYNPRLHQLLVVGYTNGVFPGATQRGAQDAFLSVISFSGTGFSVESYQWGTIGNDVPTGVITDSLSNTIYVSGYTSGQFHGFTSSGGNDCFISVFSGKNPQYPPNTYQWGTNQTDQAVGLASSPSDENVYTVGWSLGIFADAYADQVLSGSEAFVSGVRKEVLTVPTSTSQVTDPAAADNLVSGSPKNFLQIGILLGQIVLLLILIV